jgi:hypothetical protein
MDDFEMKDFSPYHSPSFYRTELKEKSNENWNHRKREREREREIERKAMACKENCLLVF